MLFSTDLHYNKFLINYNKRSTDFLKSIFIQVTYFNVFGIKKKDFSFVEAAEAVCS